MSIFLFLLSLYKVYVYKKIRKIKSDIYAPAEIENKESNESICTHIYRYSLAENNGFNLIVVAFFTAINANKLIMKIIANISILEFQQN